MKKILKMSKGKTIAFTLVNTMFILFIITSCKKESDEEHINTFPPEVREVLMTFLSEAKNRGVKIKIKKLNNVYYMNGPSKDVKDINGNNAIAFYRHSNNSIFLDTTSFEFKNRRELMIFHELGHGILKREHKYNHLPNGDCASIMNGIMMPNYCGVNEYKRDYYINELFDEKTLCPQWAK